MRPAAEDHVEVSVGVSVGVDVSVGVSVSVGVIVAVGVDVDVDVGVAVAVAYVTTLSALVDGLFRLPAVSCALPDRILAVTVPSLEMLVTAIS